MNASIIIVEYIWIDAFNQLRSKVRTCSKPDNPIITVKDITDWNFDGSSTGQSETLKSEIILKPKALYPNPLLNEAIKAYLVLCDCYDTTGDPIASNHRVKAYKIFSNVEVVKEDIWFGLEQEYVLYNQKTKRLLGWPDDPHSFPEKQGKYYCGVGSDRSPGRQIAEEHYITCLKAGFSLSGFNEEVLPGQWEYQIGICKGIEAADQLWISRYLLHRIAQKYDVIVSFDPKPITGDWNGTGLHHNISTNKTRKSGGIDDIYVAINKLKHKHVEHLAVYGDNSKRLIGTLETSNVDEFTYGISDRSASIRIPHLVSKEERGYFEDRRVAGDADPYLSTSIIAETIILTL